MKKADLLKIKKEGNALTKKVVNVILSKGSTDDMEQFIKDVICHGCISGIVGELVYYTDTTEFYKKYKKEIQALLKEAFSQTGISSPTELFGDKWDNDDPLAEDVNNQNLLAWFGFEETVKQIADQLKIS